MTENLTKLSQEIDRVFALQQSNRQNIKNTTAKERIARLTRMRAKILAESAEIQQALYADLKKSASETNLTEIFIASHEIRHVIRHLKKWVQPKKVTTPIIFSGGVSRIVYEPRGVVLIVSPWNFPFQLTIAPLVSAIAAGNCVIVKPSECSPHISAYLKKFIGEIFNENEVALFEGDSRVADELLKKPFDHIFFTGSPAVGKIVMEAAAKNLTSITLELGGKSPVIIDDVIDIKEAVKKICWGRYSNCGQQCVAPEFVLLPEKRKSDFIQHAGSYIARFYGASEDEIAQNLDYARIVNVKHFYRIKNLFDDAVARGATVHIGGGFNEADLFIAPTILSNVPPGAKIMQEEIFGPILQIMTYKSVDEALSVINSKENPLALYIFSRNNSFIDTILQNTTAGGTCINDVLVQFTNISLPFGGVNHSGIGNSHGYFGFKTFTHERAVFKQPKYSPVQLFYPPYTNRVQKLIDLLIKLF